MSLAPDTPEGHVYYIRLTTHKGIFYKIGFTKSNDVIKRFSYRGSQNYKLIDKVLLFKYSPFAYEIEQMCHSHLRPHKSYKGDGLRYLFADMSKHPFFRDGQSELYTQDVLGLDPEYKPIKSFLGFGKAKPHDLVFGHGLDFGFYHESFVQESKDYVYKTLINFFSGPLKYDRPDFISDNGDWVVKLNKWSWLNAAASLSDRTIHCAPPMPTTREGWLNLRTFNPVWAWINNPPSELGYLENLETIDLHSGEINALPDSIYYLTNLKVIKFIGSIESISPKIENLTGLEVLSMENYDNSLITFPAEVFTLPNLTIYTNEATAAVLREMAPDDTSVVISTDYPMVGG
ncbi:GIY-YIG nuclease family protein [Vreelandella rituensis]|uniref:Uncharacterized protein n=1 Tax=Vreelandella rituensis TaxID=2282306 RepID=A0A368U8V7_9GAMM|nr:GIY-YIG nuclease family protein [Halomonas rituensis]RCV93619.1 hypothetical protein DU506_00245 [Halomonas rituensis]